MEAIQMNDQLDLIGSRLSVLAKGTGLTQEEIANKLQISRITINRFFKGRTEIRSGDLVQLLGVFGIDVAVLLDEKIQRLLMGKSIAVSSEAREISRAIEELDPQVSRTLMDQISWFRNSQKSPLG